MPLIAAISLLAVGAVHIQQYIVQDPRVIPTIGLLFLLNFIGGAVLGLYFLIPVGTRAGRVRLLLVDNRMSARRRPDPRSGSKLTVATAADPTR